MELLRPDTEYSFSVQAFNELGHSGYTKDVVKAKTTGRRCRGEGGGDGVRGETDCEKIVQKRCDYGFSGV